MKVLVACEYSQQVTSRLRAKGIEAYSCDIIPALINPEWHLQQDVLPLLDNTWDDHWDAIIAFPPCTHLATSGAKHFPQKIADGRQQQAIDFFMAITNAPCKKIAIENPVGIMSTVFRKPDQIIQPYQFGQSYSKRTCLWLKNLPQLIPTKIVDKGEYKVTPTGRRIQPWYSNNKKNRSITFDGIADAMADQWF